MYVYDLQHVYVAEVSWEKNTDKKKKKVEFNQNTRKTTHVEHMCCFFLHYSSKMVSQISL